jgi:hypothetical protein
MIRLVHQSATLLHWWASVAPVKTVGRRCGLREYVCTALRVGLFVCIGLAAVAVAYSVGARR